MEGRRRAVAAMTAVAGLLVALLAALVPALGPSHEAAASTVRAATGTTARLVLHQPGAVPGHQLRAEREAGAGPGIPAACPPSAVVVAPPTAGAVTVPVLRTDAPWRSVRCTDGRAPPAARPLAVPLSLG